jgi:perosamine synthetase
MDPILELARKYHLVVIEDATESLGAKYKGRAVGCLGDIACFSFNGNKLITTGGGGMIVTAKEDWACQARYLTTQAKDDTVEFVHEAIGYNYRLTNIQAAMGCAQLEKLGEFIAAKRRLAATYSEAFKGIPGLTPMREAPWAFSSFWLYTALVDEVQYGMSSRALLHRLEAQKIQSRPLWQPAHLSPAHRNAQATDCSVAERLSQVALSLPSSAGLTSDAHRRVIANISRLGPSVRVGS